MSYDENPFLEDDDIGTTVCFVHQGLELVRHVLRADTGQDLVLGTDVRVSLDQTLWAMKKALGFVMEELARPDVQWSPVSRLADEIRDV